MTVKLAIAGSSGRMGRMLIESGWPHEVLLVTVVRDKKEEGHAVLTVTADKGDYILDNQTEHILLWSKTGYRFVKSVPTATSR